MKKVYPQFYPMPDHIMTMAELKEFRKLNTEIMAGHSFVELDFSVENHRRFNELSGKYLKFMNYMKHPLQADND